MKKFFLLLFVMTIYIAANAQNDSLNKSMNTQSTYQNQDATSNMHPDGYMMKNGKMVEVKNGAVIPMENDVTLSNGMKVMSDGRYQKRNGAVLVLKEGEHIDRSGKVIPMENRSNSSKNMNVKPKKGDMLLVPDSTAKNMKRKR